MYNSVLQFPTVTASEPIDRKALRERVGREIQRIRGRMGCTQAEAAEAVFGNPEMQSQWSKWERGKVLPQVGSLEAIAAWADVPMDIFGLDDAQMGPSITDIEEAKAALRRALKLLEG